MANNVLNLNKRLYKNAVPRYYKIFGYEVIIVKSDMTKDSDGEYIQDKFRKGYGSLHSSTYTRDSITKEIKVNLIIPNITKMTNMYNDTDNEFEIYHTDNELLVIGDIVKIPYNNKLYEYKVSEHPVSYYGVIYKYLLQSMYMGSIN